MEFKTKIKRSFLDNAWRNLIITKDYILFEGKDLANDSHTQFNKSEITAYRYVTGHITRPNTKTEHLEKINTFEQNLTNGNNEIIRTGTL